MGSLATPTSAAPSTVTAADAGNIASPGKATRTERLRPEDTLMHRGTASDRGEPGATTFFTEKQRATAMGSLETVLRTATDNFRDAAQDKRIELLTRKNGSSGFLLDLFFDLAGGPLVKLGTTAAFRMLDKAVHSLSNQRAGAVYRMADKLSPSQEAAKDSIGTVLKNASKVAGDQAKGAIRGGTGDRGKAEFIAYMKEGLGAFINDIMLVGTTQMDDLALQTAVMGYEDQSLHGISAYRAEIDAILARYDAHHLDDVGKSDEWYDASVDATRRPGESTRDAVDNEWTSHQYFSGDLAWVYNSSMKRLVILEGARGYNQKVKKLVDRDFEDYVLGLYIQRTGQPPFQVVNIDDPKQLGANPWAYELWLGAQFYGGGKP